MIWPEGNMSSTRHNHVLPPRSKSCANGLTWPGVAMTSSSRHPGVVCLLVGDGSDGKAPGTIAGGEAIPGDAY